MPTRNAAGERAALGASRFSFFKVEMPWRIKRVSFCALRPLPGEQFFLFAFPLPWLAAAARRGQLVACPARGMG